MTEYLYLLSALQWEVDSADNIGISLITIDNVLHIKNQESLWLRVQTHLQEMSTCYNYR